LDYFDSILKIGLVFLKKTIRIKVRQRFKKLTLEGGVRVCGV